MSKFVMLELVVHIRSEFYPTSLPSMIYRSLVCILKDVFGIDMSDLFLCTHFSIKVSGQVFMC